MFKACIKFEFQNIILPSLHFIFFYFIFFSLFGILFLVFQLFLKLSFKIIRLAIPTVGKMEISDHHLSSDDISVREFKPKFNVFNLLTDNLC